jgi:hypothetical protein
VAGQIRNVYNGQGVKMVSEQADSTRRSWELPSVRGKGTQPFEKTQLNLQAVNGLDGQQPLRS